MKKLISVLGLITLGTYAQAMECPHASAFKYSIQDAQWIVNDSGNWTILSSSHNESTKTTLDQDAYLRVYLNGRNNGLYSVYCWYQTNEARIYLYGGDTKANPNSKFYPTNGETSYACYTHAGSSAECNW